MHPPGASELCKEWMERWVTGTRKGMLRDISSLGTTKEELEVDGSRTGWLSFACRCNDVANVREKLYCLQERLASILDDKALVAYWCFF